MKEFDWFPEKKTKGDGRGGEDTPHSTNNYNQGLRPVWWLPSQLIPLTLGLNPGPHLAWQRYAPTVLTHCWL